MRHSPTPTPDGDASPILLVDDDATTVDVLRQRLSGSQYRLFVARNGEDAVRVARRARPMVILLDVVMAGIDGYETCRRLKEDPETRDAAVIFLSALSDPNDKVRGFEAGAVDFITKPFVVDEVIARIHTHLAIQRLLRRQAEARSPKSLNDATGAGTMMPPAVGEGTSAESVFRTGDVVAFRFRIVRYLARGGMGELYEAEDLELRERLALKTILSTIADSERSISLFKREVHLARQVTHPNVCRIYDVFRHRPPGVEGQDIVFLAMELLHGETLADRLQREGRLQTADILPMARQMAAGLAAAHRVGVVHRDFKSPNVMLVEPNAPDQEMRVVITDFGLARRSTEGEATAFSLSFADAGVISGTPAYMAPEQVEGGEVTPATDVYALGVVLYELVTGVQPFVADSAVRTAIKRLHEPPPSPRVHVPDLDPRWEATILRCLARDPADRFSTALDVVASLEGTGVEEAAAKRPPSRRWAVSAGWRAAVFSLTGALVLVAIALVAGRVWLNRASTDAPIDSLAVLPFVNVGADPNAEYLSDGLTENLINSFSQLPRLRVVPRSTVFRYKGRDLDLQQIGRELTVHAVLTGRVVQRGDTVNIQTDLVDVAADSQLWGRQYTLTIADLMTVQEEIATAVSDRLRLQPNADEQKVLTRRYTENPEAHQLYLKGQFYWNRRTAPTLKRAVEYFQQAIERDPAYALAWAGLADCYALYPTYGAGSPRETVPQGKEAALTALQIDETVHEAHTALGWIKMTYDWDWPGAERAFQRAIELNPRAWRTRLALCQLPGRRRSAGRGHPR